VCSEDHPTTNSGAGDGLEPSETADGGGVFSCELLETPSLSFVSGFLIVIAVLSEVGCNV
jgi:hypothetical protein